MSRENHDSTENTENSENTLPVPYAEDAELAVTPKYRKHFLRYPYRAYSDASEEVTEYERTLQNRDASQIATQLYLESKLKNWDLPRVDRNKRNFQDSEISQYIEETLIRFLDNIDPDLTFYDDELYHSYKESLLLTLNYTLCAFPDDETLQTLLHNEAFSIRNFRADIFLTFLSRKEIRQKVSELLGFCWLNTSRGEFIKKLEGKALPETRSDLPQRIIDEVFSRITCLVEGARVIPELARMIVMNPDDHQLLKGDMACMGNAKGMYMIFYRPARQFEKDSTSEEGTTTKEVIQPLYTPIESKESVGAITLLNLPEESAVVAQVPSNCNSTFSISSVFPDYQKNNGLLHGVRVIIIMTDEPDFAKERILESRQKSLEDLNTALHKTHTANTANAALQTQDTLPDLPANSKQEISQLADMKSRYGDKPWFKELEGNKQLNQQYISVKTLNFQSAKDKYVVVDLKERAVFLGDKEGDLARLEVLEDIV